MAYMTPSAETSYVPQTTSTASANGEEQQLAKVQKKLDKFVKAAKKEDNLSPGFQHMVHEEMKKDSKESSRNLHAAVTAFDKAKEQLMEVESSRAQLWAQWRTFLQNSVVKWKEYTAQFQASETSFQAQIQEATANLKRTQRRMDIAKRRVDVEAEEKEDGATIISDEEGEEMDFKDVEDIPKDENAEKIQVGLQQVVASLEELSESAERLEPKAKRPRSEEGTTSKLTPNARPFGQADAS